jgi:hypothetical protein
MKLGPGITVHTSEEAKKAWKQREKHKSSCPACEIQGLKKKRDYNNKGNDNIEKEDIVKEKE